jgi:hypothetical protein
MDNVVGNAIQWIARQLVVLAEVRVKRPLPYLAIMLFMMAAELVATGACEMFWFQGLSAGNRFELSSEPRAVGMGITRRQSKRTPPYTPPHRETIVGLSNIEEQKADGMPDSKSSNAATGSLWCGAPWIPSRHLNQHRRGLAYRFFAGSIGCKGRYMSTSRFGGSTC